MLADFTKKIDANLKKDYTEKLQKARDDITKFVNEKLKNLKPKSFAEKKVLQGVDLTINEGETLAIIGRSGCGKSVLLKHIVGLLFPDEGYGRLPVLILFDQRPAGTSGARVIKKTTGFRIEAVQTVISRTDPNISPAILKKTTHLIGTEPVGIVWSVFVPNE